MILGAKTVVRTPQRVGNTMPRRRYNSKHPSWSQSFSDFKPVQLHIYTVTRSTRWECIQLLHQIY